jgi:hypothetical protein
LVDSGAAGRYEIQVAERPRAQCGLGEGQAAAGFFESTREDRVMQRKLISTIFAAGLAAFAVSAIAAETVKAGGPSDKPGRTIDESTVKAGGATDRPGRTVEEEPFTSQSKRDKPGRAVEEQAVKSGGPSDKPGRTLDTDAVANQQ